MTFRNVGGAAGRPGYLWMGARAKNALQRLTVLGTIAAVVFVSAIVAFVVLPRKASRSAQTATAAVAAKTDSLPVSRVRDLAQRRMAAADSQLEAARRLPAVAAAGLPDTFPPAIVARRDTLGAAISHLQSMIVRAGTTPLPSSYRALAESPLVAGDLRIPVLLDSLSAVDRDRAAYGAVGAADPGYAALSARAAEIGRTIVGIAIAKRDRLRMELAVIRPPAAVTAPRVFVDTMRFLSERANALVSLSTADAELAQVRAQNKKVDDALGRARDLANLGAPPWAMLAAALVLAAALGFAGSLMLELYLPHIADSREAAQIAGERVLAIIGPVPTVVERGRRQSDVDAPPLIDVISEAYRSLYLHIASVGAGLPIVTITGDEPEIVATVAANLAATAAYEARSALLVDTDPSTSCVAAVLRIAPSPGLSDILSGTATWPEAVKATTIGRDRPLDVLTSGAVRTNVVTPDAIRRIRDEMAALKRRYDFIIVAAPTGYVQRTSLSIIPSREILLTARIGRTPVSFLRSAAESLRGAAMEIQGLILWDAPFPVLEKKEDLARFSQTNDG